MTTEEYIIFMSHILLNHSSNFGHLIYFCDFNIMNFIVMIYLYMIFICLSSDFLKIFGQIAQCAKLFPRKVIPYQFILTKRYYE